MFNRKRPKVNVSVAKEILHDYAERTTIHGIRYICDRNRSIFERVWWLIAAVTSILCCGYFITNIIDKLDRTPVMVSFADRSIPIINVSYI